MFITNKKQRKKYSTKNRKNPFWEDIYEGSKLQIVSVHVVL